MSSISDKKFLFKQISEGNNKAAFDIFFEHYYPKLIQFARIFVCSEQQAEDVVSEVLTNMLVRRKKVFALNNFEGYLFSSVKNKALSAIRKQRVADDYSQNMAKNQYNFISFLNPHDQLAQQEFHTFIYEVIENMPPKRKMVFQLIRSEGLSYSEVADLLDISDRTVEVHLRLAVKTLRKRVEENLLQDTMNLVET